MLQSLNMHIKRKNTCTYGNTKATNTRKYLKINKMYSIVQNLETHHKKINIKISIMAFIKIIIFV